MSRTGWLVVAGVLLAGLLGASAIAPEFLSVPEPSRAYLLPWEAPPFGTDDRGIGLHEVALQGAAIVTLPALASAAVVALLATIAGLVRCMGFTWLDGALHGVMELVGSLPRLVVVLVVALILPRGWEGLLPIGLTWALLAAPGAMDEAAATAGRLGGERFVEALRAHGFSSTRIHLYHVVWLNLRPVLVRQAAEVLMQVVFLEIGLSYLALRRSEPSFTHPDSSFSWATLLYQGYTALLGVELWHALALGLALVAAVALLSTSLRLAARPR
ncbi:MAG: hypothetical protein ABMA64_40810 [Myxococcota bacterium]